MMPSLSSNRRLIVVFALLPLFAGCSWFEWMGFEEEYDAEANAERAARVTAIQSPTPTTAPMGETMADRDLQDVYQKQNRIYQRLAQEGASISDPDYDRLLREVITQYQSYLATYPDSLYGWILYGKLLRDVGERDLANQAFVRANRLDGNVAVVKQQIGNYLAEDGEPAVALAYYLAAVELEPGESVYNYQVGELLYTYREELIAEDALERHLLEQQMIESFAKAHLLDPGNRQLKQRYAESFFDITQPNWEAALRLWSELANSSPNQVDRQWAQLQQARVLIAMGRRAEARNTLSNVTLSSLQDARDRLLREIDT
ncbi:MAG: tetratricopeptide repeat protein [Puniceicoccales bacterium]